ncbi:EF-hand domain-containing protein [Cognatiyoonia sp. IB215182]|uniref:EF-hand domain-containing protein n=1 Tax=Cognatiyoonia sp. IB215182 TaxID=3097353 RepID=UPI002A1441E4|nr:EF-hand domain-containing protein [Cognatiyoonia sp. IB215182]MDX8351008.1 EF-hand domain-containing protein [Cognatiyoonia sp. IB215182]
MKKTILLTAMISAVVMSSAAAQAQDGPRERPDFQTLDLNNDGSLTLEEMQAQGAARFAAADTNGDGGLSAEEMTAAADARQAERIGRMMDRFDANDDGLLQQGELPQRGDRAGRMFERIDADGDGAISQAEFDAAQERAGGHKGQRDRG